MSLWKKLGFDELWETAKEVVEDVKKFDQKVDEKTKKWRVEKDNWKVVVDGSVLDPSRNVIDD